MCLAETKAKIKKIARLNRHLRFKNVKHVDSLGIAGGMCILWDESIDFQLVEISQDFIDSFVFENNGVGMWRFTFVYGNPVFDLRQGQWQRLILSNGGCGLPWLCLGDFNDILSINENEVDRLKE